jgi:hypothetical protein
LWIAERLIADRADDSDRLDERLRQEHSVELIVPKVSWDLSPADSSSLLTAHSCRMQLIVRAEPQLQLFHLGRSVTFGKGIDRSK